MNNIGFSWQAFKQKWDMLNRLLPVSYTLNQAINKQVWRNR